MYHASTSLVRMMDVARCFRHGFFDNFCWLDFLGPILVHLFSSPIFCCRVVATSVFKGAKWRHRMREGVVTDVIGYVIPGD